jgi:NAD(P)-dependent dehydrogenase (short-subunit alcohol dehydrogenase family)
MPLTTDRTLEGHVALITGSNRNIGRAIALELAKAGAAVVVNGHRDRDAIDAVVDEIRSAGGRAIGCLADVSMRADMRRMVKEASDAFGKVDIAVSNVGIRNPVPFLELSEEEWDFTLRTNLSASFHLAQETLPCMIAQRWGRIIHIVGGSNFFAYATRRAHSIAAKAGMHGLTKALAKEFGPMGVTVNTVAPGNVNTERDWSKYRKEDHDRAVAQIPLQRQAETDDIAAACLYLCNAGSYVSGQVLHVNGAQHIA